MSQSGAADKAESLTGRESLYRHLPVFRRLAYLERAEATKHDRPRRRSPSCPAAILAAVGTIRGASKLGGRNITEYLQPRKVHLREVVIRRSDAGSRPNFFLGEGRWQAAVGSRDWLQPARTLQTRLKTEGGESPTGAAHEPVRAMTEG